ncbi:MAG: threonine--tRNA ligase, partial [Deltaproteobacteria bacterium]|nr:threonine--tRNA ligase [Deltaproteobacteria bacterium]
MENIHVTLPGGKTVEVRRGTRIDELLASAGGRKGAIAAKINGDVVDLKRAVEADCAIEWVPFDSPEGLDVLRHSTAHLMAQAVQSLFPGTQVTIGPTIENGFYYDFKRDQPFTPEELEQIEKRMQELARAELQVTREELPRGHAIELFRQMGETYKVEIIEGIPSESVSLYRQGDWFDLCRGPHVPSTAAIKAFKLTSVAGAYWRGDSNNEQLQRIYGTAWASRKDLDAYLKRIEEAKQRDHRRIGPALDLFSLHPIAPGSPFFHPKGTVVYNSLVEYVRGLYGRYGYSEVVTPLIYKTELWKTSGHYEAFHGDMFLMRVEDGEYGVKPMNCP